MDDSSVVLNQKIESCTLIYSYVDNYSLYWSSQLYYIRISFLVQLYLHRPPEIILYNNFFHKVRPSLIIGPSKHFSALFFIYLCIVSGVTNSQWKTPICYHLGTDGGVGYTSLMLPK